jgi:hypothetical protein
LGIDGVTPAFDNPAPRQIARPALVLPSFTAVPTISNLL